MRLAITGIGLVTPLGCEPSGVALRALESRSVLQADPELEGLPSDLSARVPSIDLKPWLKRRKDRKLMVRAAQLALPAAGRALGDWPGDREDLGLFMGIGREPPDEGDAEAALAASAVHGALDPAALAGPGRDLYPPLLPLRTLPNLALSHVSINLGIRGDNGTVAGEAGAGLAALHEACHAVREGRCPAALAGAADSRVDYGSARDLYRLGRAGPQRAPAEGAVFLLVEPLEAARSRSAAILGLVVPLARRASPGWPLAVGAARPSSAGRAHHPLTGDLGAGDGLFMLVLALMAGEEAVVAARDDEGAAVQVRCEPGPVGAAGRDSLVIN